MDYNSLTRGYMVGLVQGLLLCWPLFALLLVFWAIKVALIIREKRRLAVSGIAEIDNMDGLAFEKYLEVLHQKLGYAVERTAFRGDFGGDLVTCKDGVRTVVQAKRSKRRVGVRAVQEALAAQGYYGCTAAVVITNSTFTRQAVELARANGVSLQDRDWLVGTLTRLKAGEARSQVSDVAPRPTRPEPATPEHSIIVADEQGAQCSVCQRILTDKVREYCLAHPQRFGGKLYCYQHQQAGTRTTGPKPVEATAE